MTSLLAPLLLATSLALEPAVEEPAAAEPVEDQDSVSPPAGPDRSTPPTVTPPERLPVPSLEVHDLNGIPVHLGSIDGVRKAYVRVQLAGGSLELDGLPSPRLLAMNASWDVATASYSAMALSERQDALDATVESWLSYRRSGVTLTVPRSALVEGLELLEEVLWSPTFPKAELKRYQAEMADWYVSGLANSGHALARNLLLHGWFGEGTVYATRPDLAALRALKRRDLVAAHEALLQQARVESILVVGDLDWADIKPHLPDIVRDLQPGQPEPEPVFVPSGELRVLAVDRPGSQAILRLRTPGPLRNDPLELAATHLDFALGGAFLSRLNLNLREEKGLTYGAWSSLTTGPSRGHLTVGVEVPTESVGVAITEIRRELAALIEAGATEQEIRDGSLSWLTSWNRTLETASSAASLYSSMLWYGVTLEDMAERAARHRNTSSEQTRTAASTYFSPKTPHLWVVVGDRAQIEPQLDALDLPTTWILPELAALGLVD